MTSSHKGWSLATGAILVLGALVLRNALVAQPDPRGWLEALPAGDALRSVESAGVTSRKLRLGEEARNALIPVGGREVTFDVLVQSGRGTQLDVSFASVCPPETSCRGARRFSVTAQGEPEPLMDVTLEDPTREWQVRRVDLSEFAGQRITLRLTHVAVAGWGSWWRWWSPPVGVWAEPLVVAPEPEPRPNLVLISIDTLRADRLGAYGHPRPTSPVLDALAADGVRFASAISQAPWTTPSHMSLLTSLYPSSHGVNWSFETLKSAQAGRGTYRMLPESIPMLAELLRTEGFRTLALTGGGTVGDEFGFARGFDIYRGGVRRADEEAQHQLREWLDQYGRGSESGKGGGAPFFLFFHTFEVHAAYTRLEFAAPLLADEQRAEMERLFAEVGQANIIRAQRRWLEEQGLMRAEITGALYDGGVRQVDRFLGRFFDDLRALGLYDDTIVVVTSDHGEEFGDHDPKRIYDAHGTTLYDELIHVPLIVRAPGALPAGAVVTQPVELVDVTPTLLELLGLDVPVHMQGESLVDLARGGPGSGEAVAFSESTSTGHEWKSLRSGTEKYLLLAQVPDGRERSGIPGPPVGEALFDLDADPQEEHNLIRENRSRAAHLRNRVLEHFAASGQRRDAAAPTRAVSSDSVDQLRALGYVE